jgi:hypothetical protein
MTGFPRALAAVSALLLAVPGLLLAGCGSQNEADSGGASSAACVDKIQEQRLRTKYSGQLTPEFAQGLVEYADLYRDASPELSGLYLELSTLALAGANGNRTAEAELDALFKSARFRELRANIPYCP